MVLSDFGIGTSLYFVVLSDIGIGTICYSVTLSYYGSGTSCFYVTVRLRYCLHVVFYGPFMFGYLVFNGSFRFWHWCYFGFSGTFSAGTF